ncbi:hypothetical protein MTR_2g082655 [Medicago truncatula]|uniref:Uncharacterized protein n=1 Tax=Medicago truncatula TaxID=3880 RepID=A0A072VB65_MEDTR|nr:hypothetical protein MTR_2g082655 [Medicago truncatula]
MHTLTKDAIPTYGKDIRNTTESWTNAKKKVNELITDDQGKLTKSSITKVTEKKNHAIYDFTSETKMIPSKGLEAGRTGFNQQEGINAKQELVEPKDDQEKQIESSNTTISEMNNNVEVDTFGQTFRIETVPCKSF